MIRKRSHFHIVPPAVSVMRQRNGAELGGPGLDQQVPHISEHHRWESDALKEGKRSIIIFRSSSPVELVRLWKVIGDQFEGGWLGDAFLLLRILHPFRQRLSDHILPIFYARLGVCTLRALQTRQAREYFARAITWFERNRGSSQTGPQREAGLSPVRHQENLEMYEFCKKQVIELGKMKL